jgi:hypothetical protein
MSFSNIHLIYFILTILFVNVICRTHWKLTETGRIENKDDSDFTLLRPYDFHAFIKQTFRFQRLAELKELLACKKSTTKRDSGKEPSVSVATYQENFYKTDPDCVKAGQQLTKFSFYETHLWRTDHMKLPSDIMSLKEYDIRYFKKPICSIVDLPFSMKTFDHLESLRAKHNVTMLPETELLTNLIVDSEEFYGHLVHLALNSVCFFE